jgi:hypothetical protein
MTLPLFVAEYAITDKRQRFGCRNARRGVEAAFTTRNQSADHVLLRGSVVNEGIAGQAGRE